MAVLAGRYSVSVWKASSTAAMPPDMILVWMGGDGGGQMADAGCAQVLCDLVGRGREARVDEHGVVPGEDERTVPLSDVDEVHDCTLLHSPGADGPAECQEKLIANDQERRNT